MKTQPIIKQKKKKTKGGKNKVSRRENKINHSGSACFREILKLLNKILEKYGLKLKPVNFETLFSRNYLYHIQFMIAKIYQILIKNVHNEEVISKMVFEIKDREFIYILNLTFEFVCKYFSEEERDNDMIIDEKKEKAIKALKEASEQIIEEMQKKGGFTEEKIYEEKNAFKLNSQAFFKDFANIKPRQPKCPDFQFDVINDIENYFK